MMWLDIARRLGKNAAWAILTLVPFINFVAIGVMAFGTTSSPQSFPPHNHTPTRQPSQVG
jgi:hypothetical protein